MKKFDQQVTAGPPHLTQLDVIVAILIRRSVFVIGVAVLRVDILRPLVVPGDRFGHQQQRLFVTIDDVFVLVRQTARRFGIPAVERILVVDELRHDRVAIAKIDHVHGPLGHLPGNHGPPNSLRLAGLDQQHRQRVQSAGEKLPGQNLLGKNVVGPALIGRIRDVDLTVVVQVESVDAGKNLAPCRRVNLILVPLVDLPIPIVIEPIAKGRVQVHRQSGQQVRVETLANELGRRATGTRMAAHHVDDVPRRAGLAEAGDRDLLALLQLALV